METIDVLNRFHVAKAWVELSRSRVELTVGLLSTKNPRLTGVLLMINSVKSKEVVDDLIVDKDGHGHFQLWIHFHRSVNGEHRFFVACP